MRAYIFFSVYEPLFHEVALGLRRYGVDEVSGFLWGRQQLDAISGRGIEYRNPLVFSRDLLPLADDGQPPDLEWLARRERELGVSINRMLAAERHLLAGRTHAQILRLAEVALRTIAQRLDELRPDFLFSEDVSCFHSYAHFVLARERGIKFWCIGRGRVPGTLGIYSRGFQRIDRVESTYARIREQGLAPEERALAEGYVRAFQDKPARPTGMDKRAKPVSIGWEDVRRFTGAVRRQRGDAADPTVAPPLRVMGRRLERMMRVRMAELRGVFEEPVDGERYVLYPIHFQPEASTLVQAPMYLDQVALLEDVARSLPVGVRLYVKEHLSNRGRRPLSFYSRIRAIPSVRLIGPDADTWTLIRNAQAVAVITGTMGWEALLFGKPVVSFGDVFFDVLPHVYRAREVPKDGWFALIDRAVHRHAEDRDALLALVAALHAASYPGRIHNPESYPDVLEPDNVRSIVEAMAAEMGLRESA